MEDITVLEQRVRDLWALGCGKWDDRLTMGPDNAPLWQVSFKDLEAMGDDEFLEQQRLCINAKADWTRQEKERLEEMRRVADRYEKMQSKK